MAKKIIKISIILTLILAIIAGISISVIFKRIKVSGSSMQEQYNDGDMVWIKTKYYSVSLNDVIVFDYENERYIKRVVGLPGDTVIITNNNLYRNNSLLISFDANYLNDDLTIKLGENEYFVMGDNYNNSKDSRYYGAITKNMIIGVVL